MVDSDSDEKPEEALPAPAPARQDPATEPSPASQTISTLDTIAPSLSSTYPGALGSGGASLELGTIVAEKYKVLSLLGHGGMGAVYKVQQLFLNTEFALKLLDTTRVSDNVQLRRFQQEAKATSTLHHLNLLRVHDFGLLPSNQPYFVMDFVQGETLAEHIRKNGPLSIQQMEPIFAQICAGLAAAHRRDVIHRDIKPNNIMLLENAFNGGAGSVKIIDFGIAKIATEGSDALTMTRTGEVFGSPAYMSPEQCSGGDIDNRTDIYSLGCVLFEALTGTPPFVAESSLRMMMLHQSGEVPTLREATLGHAFPDAVEKIVAKLLAKDRALRYSDADAAAHDFSRAVAGSTVDITSRRPLQQKQTARLQLAGSHMALIVVGALVFSALITLTSLSLSGQLAENSECSRLMRKLFNSDKGLQGLPVTASDRSASTDSAGQPRTAGGAGAADVEGNPGASSSSAVEDRVAFVASRENALVSKFIASQAGKPPSIKSEYFSENGKKEKRLTFPSFRFGLISSIDQPGWREHNFPDMLARGAVVMPAAERLNLRLDLEHDRVLVNRDPAIYAAIGPDELTSLEYLGAKQAMYYDTSPVGLAEDKMLIYLLRLARGWNNLHVLQIGLTVLNESEVEAINELPHLDYFYARELQFDDRAFSHPEFMHRISSFGCYDMDFRDFEKMLKGSSKLKFVSVQSGVLHPSAFLDLRSCPNLNEIRIGDKPVLTDQVFKNLASLRQVHRYTFDGNFIEAKRVKMVLANPSVEAIYLSEENLRKMRAAGLTDKRILELANDPL